jgi:CheY-like chemotaxis protein
MVAPTDGPILYINDDEDDHLLFREAINSLSLSNEIRFFVNGDEALAYLETTPENPFLILCDLIMPLRDGLELRQAIDSSDYLKQKAIPFIFFTTEASPSQVRQAYKGTIQGFHIKAPDFTRLKQQISLIIAYWHDCLHPNSFATDVSSRE